MNELLVSTIFVSILMLFENQYEMICSIYLQCTLLIKLEFSYYFCIFVYFYCSFIYFVFCNPELNCADSDILIALLSFLFLYSPYKNQNTKIEVSITEHYITNIQHYQG